ncbi:hypothetical protein HUG10_20800 (plasmid) [Halorarum halophilum]|uniref:Type II toxin-antitoxin system RelE/ParE family toxin n=1 Tax=Halorarum halophilum TaxID=2743090 RepID=A0A7D5GPV0_9EURY|nr:hypothetical protein [Halobaculum halophilum]QLG30044.1 hypothetical protein HUG10_20800 [Halobaculum halophilum]
MPLTVSEVTLHTEYVFSDLSSSKFSDQDKEDVLDDVDELREQLTTWNRYLNQSLGTLTTDGPHTVYRRRVGDLRSYFVRDGDTLWCIGVGERKNTYDRDLDKIIKRADTL